RGAGRGAPWRRRRGDLPLLVDGEEPGDAARRRPVAAALGGGGVHRPGHGPGGRGAGAAAPGDRGGAHGTGAGGRAAPLPTLNAPGRGGCAMTTLTRTTRTSDLGFTRTRRTRRTEALRGLVRETR